MLPVPRRELECIQSIFEKKGRKSDEVSEVRLGGIAC